jgi:hypothetical protein
VSDIKKARERVASVADWLESSGYHGPPSSCAAQSS